MCFVSNFYHLYTSIGVFIEIIIFICDFIVHKQINEEGCPASCMLIFIPLSLHHARSAL